MCLGVFERWSSPRITWLTCIARSSTTFVKWNSGLPSARTITKSPPSASVAISTWPRMTSSNATIPSPTRKRIDRPPALGLERGALVGGQVRAATDVAGRSTFGLGELPVGLQLLGRAVARVRLVLGQEPLRRSPRTAGRAATGDTARTRRASPPPADLGTLVPGQAQPVEPVEDVLLESDRRAGRIGVLEPEDERAAVPAREQVVEQRGARRPDVEGPRWARGHAGPDGPVRRRPLGRRHRGILGEGGEGAGRRLRRCAPPGSARGERAPDRRRRGGRGRARPASARAWHGRAVPRA